MYYSMHDLCIYDYLSICIMYITIYAYMYYVYMIICIMDI